MVGGNFNNGSNDGPVYFNLNNDWGNTNYNIGLRPFLPHPAQIIERKHIFRPHAFLGRESRNPTPETAW